MPTKELKSVIKKELTLLYAEPPLQVNLETQSCVKEKLQVSSNVTMICKTIYENKD